MNQALSNHWQLKRRDPARPLEQDFASAEGWLSARVPGTVYQTLLEHGAIPDPFYDREENTVQWVGESDWLYRLEFEITPETADAARRGETTLCFDGLDTFATVWLNGTEILNSDNMFLPQQVRLTELRAGPNELRLLFQSAWARGKALEAAHGGPRPLWNGDSSRLQVRKAQYHYSWDWGPKLLDLGPWRTVRLETRPARITEWHAQTSLNASLNAASLEVTAQLEGDLSGARLHLELFAPDGSALQNQRFDAESFQAAAFQIPDPALWYPHRYGPQPLYRLELRLERDGQSLDTHTQRLGLRQVRVVQEPVMGEPGSSFYFEINDLPIFLGGANWIPDDLMLTRVSPERYRERITQTRDAGMQMLRVWGGGIYEEDTFYDLCDELGVLVWQDFMFGCGIYPAHADFRESVRREATANIKRLRHHPSIVIWAGNNEDYPLAYGLNWYRREVEPEMNPEMPARVIYERLLPELCTELMPGVYYQPGSPYFGSHPDDQTVGDRHTWEVWGRDAAPYREYQRLEGRFVSEFGMGAAPHRSTLEAVLPPEERHPQSPGFRHHIKADQGQWRLEKYLADLYPSTPSDFDTYIYGTQLVQSEALNVAFRIWRRRWGQSGARAVGGALVWQINDCWPVTSWAIVDSQGIPKPAYYAARRALEPITVNLWTDGAVWASNLELEAVELTLELRTLTLDGTEVSRESRRVTLDANATTELGVWARASDQVIAARLLDGERVVAREALFPEPLRDHAFNQADSVRLERHGKTLTLSALMPVKGLFVDALGLSDNTLDLMPGDPQTLRATLPLPEEIALRWLGGALRQRLEPSPADSHVAAQTVSAD